VHTIHYNDAVRRLWGPVIFSFAIDKLVKSCGKHHRPPRAYCVILLYINIVVLRRLVGLVIFSFAIDKLVKSYGKHHQSHQAYCVYT